MLIGNILLLLIITSLLKTLAFRKKQHFFCLYLIFVETKIKMVMEKSYIGATVFCSFGEAILFFRFRTCASGFPGTIQSRKKNKRHSPKMQNAPTPDFDITLIFLFFFCFTQFTSVINQSLLHRSKSLFLEANSKKKFLFIFSVFQENLTPFHRKKYVFLE